jgi:hypothetical protein
MARLILGDYNELGRHSKEKEKTRLFRFRITDALSMLEHMVEKNSKYKGDFLLKKIKKYLEDYLERIEEL